VKYKEYTRKNYKKVPAAVKRMLVSLREYQWDRYTSFALDHKEIVRRIRESNSHPFTIIIISELLDDKYWNNKKYVKITREKIISELDEAVFRHLEFEINRRMSEYLEHHKDPEDIYLKKLIKEYYPYAKKHLKYDYQEIYPRSWKRKLTMKRLTKPRIKTRRERRYDLPAPLDFWDSRNSYQQYFIISEDKTICKGGSGSSGQREVQSAYGYAFALVNKEYKIPSYLFIYDRNNELRFIDSIDRLCLVPHDVGSNYSLDRQTADTLMEDVLKVQYFDPIQGINRIEIIA